jgi:hypothetical protein
MLAEHEYFAEALAHLDTYESLRGQLRSTAPGMSWLHAQVLERQGYWPHELGLLRAGLREALARQQAERR